jgi:hypothetical protein
MSSIRISDAEILSIHAIASYKTSERKTSAGSSAARETVLTITRKDGGGVTLSGTAAEAALSILRQHGC